MENKVSMFAQAKTQFRDAFLSFTLLCLLVVVQVSGAPTTQQKNSVGAVNTSTRAATKNSTQLSADQIPLSIPVDLAPQQMGMYSVGDLNGNGVIDSADLGLLLVRLGTNGSDIENTTSNAPASVTAVTGTGMQGLHAKNYLVTDGATTYSVMDVYVRFGSAVGVGASGERIVSNYGQATTDAASGNVSKISRGENYSSSGLPISKIIVNAGGSYLTAPTVTITGGGGTGALATAVLTGTAVTSVTLTDPGSGYTSIPTVTFSGGAGTGAIATASFLNFQHSNGSWMPGPSATGGQGNNTWDSFVTVGCRTQGAGNTGNVNADTSFANPNGPNLGQLVGLANNSTPPGYVGPGWYQAAPTDAGFETNASANADHMVLVARFSLKVSDIVASGSTEQVLKYWCTTTGKSTDQAGGTTMYTIAGATLKSDVATTYTTSSKVWNFSSTFEGKPGQTPWTFTTNTESAPSNLVASNGLFDDRIQLTWTTFAGATGYSVWRSDDDGATYAQIATVATNTGSYSDFTASSNTLYYYKVRAAGGTLFSNVATGITTISAPTGVAATDGTFTDKVQVSWNAVAAAGSYDIFRDAQDKVSSIVVTNGGSGYTFANISFTGGGGTGARATGVVSGGALVSVTIDSQGSGYTSAPTITIAGPSSASGAQATAKLSVGSVTAPATTYNDTTAVPGTNYTYFVKTVSGSASSGTNGSDTGYRKLATPAPPSASTGNYTAGILVNWSAVTGATGYNIYRDSDTATPVGSTTTALSYNDTSAPLAGTHTYRVKATTAATMSPLSGLSNAGWVGMTSPASGTVLATYGTYADKVVVSWDAVPGALGYRIYRGGTVGDGAVIGNVSASELSFNDTTVAVAAQYSYSVAASNAQGFGPAMSSKVGAGIRNISPPPNVAASLSTFTDKIQITWDPAPSATGYDIYRNDSAVKIGSTSGNGSTTFDDVSAVSATNYSYFVCATNSGFKLISAASSSVAGLRGAVVPTPTITSVNPNTGALAGGTLITITGKNLTSASAVTVGGVTATGVTVLSPTQITAITPAGIAGAKAVAATTPGGIASLASAFNYTNTSLPTIAAVSPTSGTTVGGTPITITGTNLTGAVVTVGSAAVTSATVTDTQITALTPAGAAGVTNIVATTSAGAATSNAFTFVSPPTIASLTPSSGFIAGGVSTVINGTNLLGASITINNAVATITNSSATQITFVTPSGNAGANTLILNTAGGTANATYTYLSPATISSISPNTGPLAGATQITINGANFTGATGVTVGGVAATGFVFVSSTQVIATVPAASAGAKDVVVVIASGSATSTGGYTYANPSTAPTLSSVAPGSGPMTGGTALTLSGTNFTGATSVTVGGVPATSFVVASATSIVAIAPAGTVGDKDVVVTTPSGSDTKLAAFTNIDMSVPTLTLVSPTLGTTLGGTAITISGTNLLGASSVKFGGVAVASFTVVSSTSITAVMAAGTAGAKDLEVVLPSATVTKISGFTYIEPTIPAPTITGVSPVSGPVGGGTSITITGTNFTGATDVTVGGVAAASFTVVSPTSITTVTPAGTSGSQTVAVTTAGGTASKVIAFTYNTSLPTFALVSPNAGPLVGASAITITGTNLANVVSVTIGGYESTSVVATATQVTALTPANSAGAKNIVLTTSDGLTVTAPSAFTYLAVPSITSVSPFTGPTAGATTITITGTNFSGATSVSFGSVPAASFTVVSATSITAVSPAASAGVVSVVVTTAGGIATKANGFTYSNLVPTITSISPNSGPSVGSTEITITGTNLDGSVTVTINGVDAPVIDNTATQISCSSPVGSAGAKDVVVTTPNGVVTKTAGFSYYVTSPIPTITTVAPATGILFGGTPFSITGTLLANTTGVTIGGVAATSVVAVSATNVTAVSPAGIVGAQPVVVTTPDGSSVTAKTFTYTDFGLSPVFGPTAGGTAITITGSNFASNTAVTVGGVAVTNKIVVSSSKIVAVTPAGTGDQDVVVSISGFPSMTKFAGFKFIDTLPTITSITPNSGLLVAGTFVTIRGTNLSGATVTIGGSAATNVSPIDTQITVSAPVGTAGA